MSNYYESRETSHETLKTCIPHPSFLLKVGCSMFYVECSPPLHLSRELYKSTLFMQNKANSPSVQDDTNTLITSTYKIYVFINTPKNKAKQSQNKPNFEPKLALFFLNEPNFKPNYVKIGNLKGKRLTRRADFFDEPESEFRAVREETLERLDFINIRSAVFVGFQAGTAGIIIESAINIVKGILATAGGALSVNRTKIIFQEAAGAIF